MYSCGVKAEFPPTKVGIEVGTNAGGAIACVGGASGAATLDEDNGCGSEDAVDVTDILEEVEEVEDGGSSSRLLFRGVDFSSK